MTATPVSPREAARWIADGEAILIDVRSPGEFGAQHIAQAISLPLDTLPEALGALRPPVGQKLIFQCLKGGRGATACAAVGDAWPERYNLDGGIEGWKDAGLPVVGASERLPLARQVQVAVGLIVLALVTAGFWLNPAYFAAAGLVGLMLAVAGVTGWCGLALVLQRMPWNRPA